LSTPSIGVAVIGAGMAGRAHASGYRSAPTVFGGALGVIDDSRAAGYGYECSTEVMGRNATVRIDHPQYRNYEWRTPGSASHGLPRDFEERFPEAYIAELESFARCVRDGEPPRVTAHDALAAFDLARAAEESWRQGRTVMVEPQRAGADVIYTVKQESR
jgi:predicted dehydrogenase